MAKNELQHYGIRGMKWGVRRYQNKDGSLTPAGRQRYADGETGESSSTPKAASAKTSSSSGKKKVSEMTDDELKAKISRLELEKRYKDLAKQTMPPDPSKRAQDFVTRVLEKSGENIATQLTTVLLGQSVNKTIGKLLGDENLVNPKKGQKDK